VDIEFEIEANGAVNTVGVIKAEPPGVFDESACAAARRWRFSVPLKDGKAVRVLARQRIQFRLEK
jgi:protein TonB